MKRAQKNLLLGLLMLGGGGGAAIYAYVTDIRDRDQRARQELEAKRLFQFSPDSVGEGVIFARGATIAFARDDVVGWRISRPVSTPADPVAIYAAIDRMAQLPVEPVDVGGEVDAAVLRKYGLERPRLGMEVVAEGRRLRLAVGAKNAIDGRYYVTDGDARRIYLADPAFHWALDRNLEGFREARVFPVDDRQVVSLTVGTPEGVKYALARGASGWTVADGAGREQPADEVVANFVLVALVKRLKAVHFLADDFDEKDAARWGLSPFGFFVELTTKQGVRWKALFGAYRETAARVLPVMHVVGSTTVVEVPDWLPADVQKSIGELRDRSLAKFDMDRARRIEIRTAAGKLITVEKQPTGWQVGGRPAAGWKIEPILMTTSRLRATRIEDDAGGLAQKGLDPPRWRLTIYDEARTKLADLRIGAAVEEELWVLSDQRLGKYPKRLESILPASEAELADTQ